MLIGLHGEARSGKDQSFTYIQEWAAQQRRPVRRDAFADRLKYSAALALGYQGTVAECVAICNALKLPGWEVVVIEPSGLQHAITGREYLQYYGTEAHREVFDNEFWVRQVMDHYDPRETLVITDVRFRNEAEAVHYACGEIWHIVRPDQERLPGGHVSETVLPPDLIDRTILNDQDLPHLRHLIFAELATRT